MMKHETEVLYQLCTKASEFDGEWKWQGAGMSYLIRTRENRLIAIDGGHEEDAPNLIEKMREITGEETPNVALWMITHPHTDHYRALLEISQNEIYRRAVKIDQLCYQLPPNPIPATGFAFGGVKKEVDALTENLGLPVLTPHTGDVLDIDGVKLRFFFTPEDFDRLKDGN